MSDTRKDLSRIENEILDALAEKPGLTLEELCEAVNGAPAYVEKVIRRLGAEKWLARRESPPRFYAFWRLEIVEVPVPDDAKTPVDAPSVQE